MPRRRATVQQAKTPEAVEVVNDAPAAAVESQVENTDETLVTEEPKPVEKAPGRPVKAARAVSTDVGVIQTKEAPRPDTGREGVPDGLILEPGDPVVIDGEDYGQYVVVKQDVYRRTFPGNSKRPSYILVYSRGTRILKSQLALISKKK